jgi:hypothetical protein
MAKKKKKQKAAEPADAGSVSVVAHPRARRSIRRLRARAGLIALVAVTWLSLRAGVPAFDAVLRGLAGGLAAHFVAWGAGVAAWRHLILGELAAHRAAQQARLREGAERRAEAASA